MPRITRRNALLGLVTFTAESLAGCSGLSKENSRGFVEIRNFTDSDIVLKVIIKRNDGNAVLLSKTYRISDDEKISEEDIFDKNGEYTIVTRINESQTIESAITLTSGMDWRGVSLNIKSTEKVEAYVVV